MVTTDLLYTTKWRSNYCIANMGCNLCDRRGYRHKTWSRHTGTL